MSRWDERRADRERLLRRRASYHGGAYAGDRARLAALVDTPKPCSCWLCGNPRRTMKGAERLTVQERRAAQRGDE